MILNDLTLAILLGLGSTLAIGGGIALGHLVRDRRYGALVAADAGPGSGRTLRSARYRIVGRPDLIRRRADGRSVPVELKSRERPPGGPPRSHIIQVWAYCLLLEETDGRSPPFGVLRYGDGSEFEVPWGREEREILLELRREMATPYDGRARPSRARCAHCRWGAVCDARA